MTSNYVTVDFDRGKVARSTSRAQLNSMHRMATNRAIEARDIKWPALEDSWARDLALVEARLLSLGLPIPIHGYRHKGGGYRYKAKAA